MEKTVVIGNRRIRLRASAWVLVIYKEQFGVDYITDLEQAGSNGERIVEAGFRLLWSMAKSANDKILPPTEWLIDIGEFDIGNALVEAKELFEKSCADVPDTSGGSGEPLTAENLLASAVICKLSVTELNKLSLGMSLKVMDEYCKMRGGDDGAIPATQEFFDSF